MRLSSTRLYRGLLAVMFSAAALFVGSIAILLLYESVSGNENPGEDLLRLIFGMVLLVLSPVVLIVGFINWRRFYKHL